VFPDWFFASWFLQAAKRLIRRAAVPQAKQAAPSSLRHCGLDGSDMNY
jgi:hypothetical protein